MGTAIKLRYDVEAKVRRMLASGMEPYEVARELGVNLPAVNAICRSMLAVAKRVIDKDGVAMERAIEMAVNGWEKNLLDFGMDRTEVECPICNTRSDFSDDWNPRQHRHHPDCLVIWSKKLLQLVRGAHG